MKMTDVQRTNQNAGVLVEDVFRAQLWVQTSYMLCGCCIIMRLCGALLHQRSFRPHFSAAMEGNNAYGYV